MCTKRWCRGDACGRLRPITRRLRSFGDGGPLAAFATVAGCSSRWDRRHPCCVRGSREGPTRTSVRRPSPQWAPWPRWCSTATPCAPSAARGGRRPCARATRALRVPRPVGAAGGLRGSGRAPFLCRRSASRSLSAAMVATPPVLFARSLPTTDDDAMRNAPPPHLARRTCTTSGQETLALRPK